MSYPYAAYAPAPAPARRRRSIAPWWVALIVLGTGLILGLFWFVLGGIPFTNHAAYGSVPVPGSGVVTLPAGTVDIFFEEDGIIGEDDSPDMPGDLQVTVSGAAGPVAVERISEMLFSSTVNNTGHVPYGRLDVPAASEYNVATAASGPSSAVAPRVTFGEPPWNPFGAPIIGALAIVAPFALLALILIAPVRRS